jgi:protein ImuB
MFAVLHLAHFPIQAVLRHEPALVSAPVALFDPAQKKSLVLATNPLARAAGVEIGMTAPQAMARCPRLISRTAHADHEKEAHATLLAVGFTLSPLIEDTAPGVCTADLKGSAPAQYQRLAHAALTRLRALGFEATVGIARTPLLALYAATTTSSSRVAILQVEHVDPDAFSHAHVAAVDRPPAHCGPCAPPEKIHSVNETQFLASLPLTVAAPSPRFAAVLANWGLRTLGDVTAISCEAFVRRFGSEGLAFWQRASGGTIRPLRPVVPPHTFTAQHAFEHTIESLDPLLFILRRFLDRLSLELEAAHFVASEINFTLQLENDTQHARSFRLPEPTADPEILFRALHTHLESVRTDSSITALSLALTPVRPLVRQQGLFEAGLRDPHGFAETLARAAALVGSDRVGTPQFDDTHRPDAIKLVPPLPLIPPVATAPIHPALAAPIRRIRPPIPARFGVLPTGTAYLWSEWIRGEINAQSKLYPSSGDWWQADRHWQRTEQDIELVEGGIYRLTRDERGEWFIEGEYD